MAFAYVGNASAATNGATELACNRPGGVAVGNLLVAVYAFEGVAAGSGPWIIPNNGQFATWYIGPGTGWQQLCWQAPAATGVGIEVWAAVHSAGTLQTAAFAASQAATTVCVAYSGQYPGSPIALNTQARLAETLQVTGNAPPAPSVLANAGELIVACGGDLMGGGGFGSPSGFTTRVDVARAGAGTVEAAIADATAAFAANTGLITFPGAAAASSTRGATATLAVRPAPATPSAGGIQKASLPPDLDLGDGYTLRVTAIDPVTGALVSGVAVTNWALEVVNIGEGGDGSLAFGDFELLPGPGA